MQGDAFWGNEERGGDKVTQRAVLFQEKAVLLSSSECESAVDKQRLTIAQSCSGILKELDGIEDID